jgi:hypothetical protein
MIEAVLTKCVMPLECAGLAPPFTAGAIGA